MEERHPAGFREKMKNLYDEIKHAESRYYTGQFASLFLLGIIAGTLFGLWLWI